jgi:methylthioribose-1-phosphate isomerase
MVDDMKRKINKMLETSGTGNDILELVISEAEELMRSNVVENENISRFGAEHIQSLYNKDEKLRIVTHCNTGALATMKYGTALGVIRALANNNAIEQVYCTETRPYNQGARLTAFELVYEKIPSTLVVDSAVSYLMKCNKIHGVVVGADRVCSNGDTANKVGTYQIAITARHHGVPFFVAAPSTSIDQNMKSGDEIHIEQRSETEITNNAQTKKRVVVEGINVWNPGFDVTPASLIDGIITELGVILKNEKGEFEVNKFLQSNK